MRTDSERAQDLVDLMTGTRLGDPVRVLMNIGPLEVELAGTFNGILDGETAPAVLVGGISGLPRWLNTAVPAEFVRPAPIIVTRHGVRITVGGS